MKFRLLGSCGGGRGAFEWFTKAGIDLLLPVGLFVLLRNFCLRGPL